MHREEVRLSGQTGKKGVFAQVRALSRFCLCRSERCWQDIGEELTDMGLVWYDVRMGKAKDKRPASGSKESALALVKRSIERPDKPIVDPKLAAQLAKTTQGLGLSPSKLYEDKGHKVHAVRYLAARAAVTRPPIFPAHVFRFLEDYFVWCAEHQVPITLGGFALWCGVTQQAIGKIERDTRDPARAEAYGKAKECIRVYLEMAAFDNLLNPVIWFHTHGADFGVVQNQQVTIRVEDNRQELTPDEFNERKAQVLELRENVDGSFGPAVG